MAHICLFAVAIFVSVYIIKIMSNQRKYLLIVESLICIPSMHSVRPEDVSFFYLEMSTYDETQSMTWFLL